MTAPPAMSFDGPPSPLRYMLAAFLPSPGFKEATGVPRIGAKWTHATVPPWALADFVQLTGLRGGESLSILFPQTWGFRLQMAVLTNRAFPLPLWGALQVRNHLLQHRPIGRGEPLDLETRVAAHRALDKGLEVDLHTAAHAASELVWEGLTTFYYRRRLNGADAPSPLARSPTLPGDELARWTSAGGSGWRFGRLTGDFNGVHWSDAYARRFQFRGAFHHPQRVLGQCLAHLGAALDASTQRLDVWLKGPVFYNSEVALYRMTLPGAFQFALRPVAEERPAIVGRWSVADRADRLIDTNGAPISG